MVGITVYWEKFWKKFRAKQPLSEGQEHEFREKQLLNEDDSMLFTVEEMMEATQNFSQKIGEPSSVRDVFFGKLPDGKGIAVKVFSLESKHGNPEWFLTEIDLLSRVHDKNLVSLLGYCISQSGARMLIYEYMSGGSLRNRLYGQTAGLSKLDWKRRLKIAIDAAEGPFVFEGLQYLHVCCTPMIIHRNVKSSNILLDGNLNGKLSDFGLSMMTMDRKAPIFDTEVAGTFGYMDPDYHSRGELTQKSDVYSFGVVLLEIICGRPPVDLSLPEQGINIVLWVKDEVRITENPGKIMEMIDKKMDGKYDMKSISSVVEESASGRPSMSEVVGELKQAFMYEKLNNATVTI